jgi:hypothetical protein
METVVLTFSRFLNLHRVTHPVRIRKKERREDELGMSFLGSHVGMDETLMRRYNGCGDNLSILSPHAGPPAV